MADGVEFASFVTVAVPEPNQIIDAPAAEHEPLMDFDALATGDGQSSFPRNAGGDACTPPSGDVSSSSKFLLEQLNKQVSTLASVIDKPSCAASQAASIVSFIEEHTTELDSTKLLEILCTVRDELGKASSSCGGADKCAVLAVRVMVEQKISVLQKMFVVGRLRQLIVDDVKNLYKASRGLLEAEAASTSDVASRRKLEDDKTCMHNKALERLDAYEKNVRLVPELLSCQPILEIISRSQREQNVSDQAYHSLFRDVAKFAEVLREKEAEMRIFHKRWLLYADLAMEAETVDDLEDLGAKISVNSNIDQDQEQDSDDDCDDDDDSDADGHGITCELEEFCPTLESLTNPRYGAVFDRGVICKWINDAMAKFREDDDVKTVSRVQKQMEQFAKRHKWKLTTAQLKDLVADVAADYANLRRQQREFDHQRMWHKISKAHGDSVVSDPRKRALREQIDDEDESEEEDEDGNAVDAEDADDFDGFKPRGHPVPSDGDTNKAADGEVLLDAENLAAHDAERRSLGAEAAGPADIPASGAPAPSICPAVTPSPSTDKNADVEMADATAKSNTESHMDVTPAEAGSSSVHAENINQKPSDDDQWTVTTVE